MKGRRPPPALVAGGLVAAALAAVALLSLAWTPEPPARIRLGLRLRAPLEAGWLGTDHFGRDLVSLLMAGAANSLAIALPAVLAGAILGTGLGAAAAARGGLFDALVMRIADVVFAFPAVLSAILVAALVGGGPLSAIVAIGVFNVPVFARAARGATLQVSRLDYVAAARASGKSVLAVARDEILPNIAGPLVVQLAIQMSLAILTEAGLSFLGLGVRPPAPSWGRMLADAQTHLGAAPWLGLAPGLAIAVSVWGLGLLGDGLRDALDPAREPGGPLRRA